MNGQASQVVQYTPGPLIGLVGLEPQFLPHIFSSTDGEQHHESETVAAARPPPPPPAAPRRGPKPTGQTKPQQPVLVQNRRCSNCEGVEIRPSQAGATIRGATDTRDPSIVNEIPGQPNRTNRYPPTVAPKACNFCITNGEALEYSHSHNLREYGPEGQSVLTCPVLRRNIEWYERACCAHQQAYYYHQHLNHYPHCAMHHPSYVVSGVDVWSRTLSYVDISSGLTHYLQEDQYVNYMWAQQLRYMDPGQARIAEGIISCVLNAGAHGGLHCIHRR